MKKKVFFIFVIILLIILIGIIVIYKYSESNSKILTIESNIKAYYCGKNYCLKNTMISGSALSYSNCKICNKKMQFKNTIVDELCLDCAQKTKRCKTCGEKLDV